MACDSPGLPRSYDEIASGAIAGVRAALDSGVTSMEVQYPPVASANARGDGSAKSEQLVAEANAKFALKLSSKLGRKAVIVAGSGDAARALGTDAISLRDAAGGFDVAICVAPCTDEQWDAALGLESKAIVVVNGLLQNGRLPHAYYYQPMTAFSQQTGGVIRCYPGPYECFSSDGTRADLEIPLARQGRRACAALAFEPNRPHHSVLDSHAASTWRSFATQLAGYQESTDVTAEQVWATLLRSRNALSCVLLCGSCECSGADDWLALPTRRPNDGTCFFSLVGYTACGPEVYCAVVFFPLFGTEEAVLRTYGTGNLPFEQLVHLVRVSLPVRKIRNSSFNMSSTLQESTHNCGGDWCPVRAPGPGPEARPRSVN